MAKNFLDDPAFNELLAEKGIAPLQPQGDLGPQRPETEVPTGGQRAFGLQSGVDLAAQIMDFALPQVAGALNALGETADAWNARANQELGQRTLPDVGIDFPTGPPTAAMADPASPLRGEQEAWTSPVTRKAQAESAHWQSTQVEQRLPQEWVAALDQTFGASLTQTDRFEALRGLEALLNTYDSEQEDWYMSSPNPDDDEARQAHMMEYITYGIDLIGSNYTEEGRQALVAMSSDPLNALDMTTLLPGIPLLGMVRKFRDARRTVGASTRANQQIGRTIGGWTRDPKTGRIRGGGGPSGPETWEGASMVRGHSRAAEKGKGDWRSKHRRSIVVNIAGNRGWAGPDATQYMKQSMEAIVDRFPDSNVVFISGGQFGADMMGLELAEAMAQSPKYRGQQGRISTAGYAPPGFYQDNGGRLQSNYALRDRFNLIDTDPDHPWWNDFTHGVNPTTGKRLFDPEANWRHKAWGYRARTSANIGDADVTLMFTNPPGAGTSKKTMTGAASSGSILTRNIALNYGSSRQSDPVNASMKSLFAEANGGQSGGAWQRRRDSGIREDRVLLENPSVDDIVQWTAAYQQKAKTIAANPTVTEINFGTGKNAIFSNLAHRPFHWHPAMIENNEWTGQFYDDLRPYNSVEHAYQTWKSGQFDAAVYGDPGWARAGYTPKGSAQKPVHEATNVNLMRHLVYDSLVQNPDVLEKLKATSGRFSHTVDDKFWSENFPRVLSEIRTSLTHMPPSQRSMAIAAKVSKDIPVKEYAFDFTDTKMVDAQGRPIVDAETGDLIKSVTWRQYPNVKVGDVITPRSGAGQGTVMYKVTKITPMDRQSNIRTLYKREGYDTPMELVAVHRKMYYALRARGKKYAREHLIDVNQIRDQNSLLELTPKGQEFWDNQERLNKAGKDNFWKVQGFNIEFELYDPRQHRVVQNPRKVYLEGKHGGRRVTEDVAGEAPPSVESEDDWLKRVTKQEESRIRERQTVEREAASLGKPQGSTRLQTPREGDQAGGATIVTDPHTGKTMVELPFAEVRKNILAQHPSGIVKTEVDILQRNPFETVAEFQKRQTDTPPRDRAKTLSSIDPDIAKEYNEASEAFSTDFPSGWDQVRGKALWRELVVQSEFGIDGYKGRLTDTLKQLEALYPMRQVRSKAARRWRKKFDADADLPTYDDFDATLDAKWVDAQTKTLANQNDNEVFQAYVWVSAEIEGATLRTLQSAKGAETPITTVQGKGQGVERVRSKQRTPAERQDLYDKTQYLNTLLYYKRKVQQELYTRLGEVKQRAHKHATLAKSVVTELDDVQEIDIMHPDQREAWLEDANRLSSQEASSFDPLEGIGDSNLSF